MAKFARFCANSAIATFALVAKLCEFHICNIFAPGKFQANSIFHPGNMQDSQRHSIFEERQINSSGAFIMHLNINGLQNKYDELKLLNDTLKAHIIVISEAKIDRSYPNSQFNIQGYYMFRKNRKKGGGGLMVYFNFIFKKILKLYLKPTTPSKPLRWNLT